MEKFLLMVFDGDVEVVVIVRVDCRRTGLGRKRRFFKGWQAATRQVAERLAPMTEVSSPADDSSRAATFTCLLTAIF
jgi:hypothetical protein